VVLAIAAGLYMVDRPSRAPWLTREEKDWLAAEFAAQEGAPDTPAQSMSELARSPWLWRCAFTWLLVMTGSYALVFWLPQLVRQMDIGGSEFMIGTLSAMPLLALAIGLTINGRRSDRKGERLLHTGIPAAAA